MPGRRKRKHEMLEPPREIVCFSGNFNRADFFYAGNSEYWGKDRCRLKRASEIFSNEFYRTRQSIKKENHYNPAIRSIIPISNPDMDEDAAYIPIRI